MQFRNLSPFDALCFSALDPNDREYHVVVLRVCYRLRPRWPATRTGWFDACLMEDDSPPLVLGDRYSGKEGLSSLICESDLAPYRPRCDVIVTGSSHAPLGQPTTSWTAGLRLSCPKQRPRRENETHVEKPSASHTDQDRLMLLDKQLVVHGPRQFRRTGRDRWESQRALPANAVPLSYERAFGGASLVKDRDHDDNGPPLLNEVCYQNPLGCGWRDVREFKLLQQVGLPVPEFVSAPQFEYPNDPIKELYLAEQPTGPLSPQQMLEAVTQEVHRPAGFGALGRAWTPRLQRAGTYDDAWLRERWPGLPKDFDFSYWNGAPADQQLAYPPPNLFIELFNLTDPAITPNGYLITQLPGNRAFVLMRMHSGVMMPLPMVTDTVHIDTQLLEIALVHRVWVPISAPVRVLETRFELASDGPLVSLAQRAPEGMQGESIEHGR